MTEHNFTLILTADIEAAEADLAAIDPQDTELEIDDLLARLQRIPNLAQQLRDAPPAIKRQTFEAFGLQIDYDKAEKRLSISATVSGPSPAPSKPPRPSGRASCPSPSAT